MSVLVWPSGAVLQANEADSITSFPSITLLEASAYMYIKPITYMYYCHTFHHVTRCVPHIHIPVYHSYTEVYLPMRTQSGTQHHTHCITCSK